jgi:HD-GYP domain-containing protein (c-di-GMP phosphodiesterase class II)
MSRPDSSAPGVHSVVSDVGTLRRQLAVLLREGRSDEAWSTMIAAVYRSVVAVGARDGDAALYVQVRDATRTHEDHSSRHALFCAVIASLCAPHLGLPHGHAESLGLAALTMNIGMTSLHNELVHRERTPTLEQRLKIDAHAGLGAQMLRAAGVTDGVWIDAVAQHHTRRDPEAVFADLPVGVRLADMLHRIDMFVAKISSRASRPAMAPTAAARDVCLGADGRPHAVGAALLKTLGIYPPGTLVKLASREVAVVVRRGERINAPVAVTVPASAASKAAALRLRDTADAAFAIVTWAKPSEAAFVPGAVEAFGLAQP